MSSVSVSLTVDSALSAAFSTLIQRAVLLAASAFIRVNLAGVIHRRGCAVVIDEICALAMEVESATKRGIRSDLTNRRQADDMPVYSYHSDIGSVDRKSEGVDDVTSKLWSRFRRRWHNPLYRTIDDLYDIAGIPKRPH